MELIVSKLSSASEFRALETEWTTLQEARPDTPIFLTWAWIDCWQRHFQPTFWILTVRSASGQLLGIAPWMIERRRGLRCLCFLGSGMAQPDHLDILAQPAHQASVMGAIAEAVRTRRSEWDLLQLQGLAADSLLPSTLSAELGQALERTGTLCPYIPLAEITDWDSFQKQRLSSHMRSKGLRYLQNLLQRENPEQVFYERIENAQDISVAMETLIAQHRDRWQQKQTYTPFEDSRFLDFHRDFAREAAKRGWLGLYRLRIGTQTIATVYGFHYRNRFFDYQHALDNAWAKFSPGRQLISFILQDCIRQGRSEYDFLCGTEKYKFSWTKETRKDRNLIWSSGLFGMFYKLALGLRDRFRKTQPADTPNE